MVTSSKILTVTYGTFSCTLEGFDDPFTTLQMVAEYFRKLAAEDRYFGGVPQVPDTETLKRIAEENNPKAIAAEIDENGITLRQTREADDVRESVATVEPVIEPAAAVVSAAGVSAGTQDPTPDAKAPNAAPEVPQADASEADAGQADVSLTEGSPLTFFTTRRNEPEDVDAEDVVIAPETAHDAAPKEAALEDTSQPRADDPEQAADAAAALTKPQRQPSTPDSVTATLEAIRKTVETAENNIAIETPQAEDVFAPDDATDTPVTEDVTPDTDQRAPETVPLVLDETDAAISDDAASEPEAVAPIKTEGVETEGVETEINATTDNTPETDAAAPEVPEADLETAIQDAAEAPAENSQPAEAAISSLSEAQEAELARDLAAALSEPEIDENQTAPEAEDTQEAAVLADAEIPDTLPAQNPAEQDATEAATADERPPRADSLTSTDVEPAIERLLEATQTKMDRPERVRRMNALDQLKAAIAAIEAEQQDPKTAGVFSANQAKVEATDLATYREDLRRAQSAPKGNGRAAAKAAPQVIPAPLILVSEQRIDAPTPTAPETEVAKAQMDDGAQSAGNLALKQDPAPSETASEYMDEDAIRGIPADAFADATSFSDFAERIGAFDLTDLLEAAAAYTSIIEDKPRFSRAQIMSKIAKLNHGDSYSKEAGLRAFGKLLREGKILRVQDGQFGISKASRFSVTTRYNE